jgi:hypothetical protein
MEFEDALSTSSSGSLHATARTAEGSVVEGQGREIKTPAPVRASSLASRRGVGRRTGWQVAQLVVVQHQRGEVAQLRQVLWGWAAAGLCNHPSLLAH